jgi:hypothetical protein
MSQSYRDLWQTAKNTVYFLGAKYGWNVQGERRLTSKCIAVLPPAQEVRNFLEPIDINKQVPLSDRVIISIDRSTIGILHQGLHSSQPGHGSRPPILSHKLSSMKAK